MNDVYDNEVKFAEGEATGHTHRLSGRCVSFRGEMGDGVLSCPHGGKVVHEEHGAIDIGPGTENLPEVTEWICGTVREVDILTGESRRVVD